MGHPFRVMRRVRDGCQRAKDVSVKGEPVETYLPGQRIDIGHLGIQREIFDRAVRHAHTAHVVGDEQNPVPRYLLPRFAEFAAQLYRQMAPDVRREYHRHAFAHHRVGDVGTVAAADVTYLRFHHACLTAQTRTGSSIPSNSCSPPILKRHSRRRARQATYLSESSTSPGADSPRSAGQQTPVRPSA